MLSRTVPLTADEVRNIAAFLPPEERAEIEAELQAIEEEARKREREIESDREERQREQREEQQRLFLERQAARTEAERQNIDQRIRLLQERAAAQEQITSARAQAARAAEEARLRRIERQAEIRQQQEIRREQLRRQREREKRAARPRHEAVVVPFPSATATTILPESAEVRFLDAGITAAVAAGSVIWTASRPNVGSQLGWATFWMLLGSLMAVEGRGELRYAGFGVLSSNASFMALRLFHPNLQQG